MVKLLTIRQLREISASYILNYSVPDIEPFLGLMYGVLASYRRLRQLVKPAPEGCYPRLDGCPGLEENPLNAWYWQCLIRGAEGGFLSGKKIAIKTMSAWWVSR